MPKKRAAIQSGKGFNGIGWVCTCSRGVFNIVIPPFSLAQGIDLLTSVFVPKSGLSPKLSVSACFMFRLEQHKPGNTLTDELEALSPD